jgi:hypothetical protein
MHGLNYDYYETAPCTTNAREPNKHGMSPLYPYLNLHYMNKTFFYCRHKRKLLV